MSETSQAALSAPQTSQTPRLPPVRPRKPRRSRFGMALLLLLGAGVLTVSILGASRFGPSENKKPPTTEVKRAPLSKVVSFGHADVPKGPTALVPALPGRVKSVKVKVNQRVKKGEVLLELDDFEARNQVLQAKAALATAQALLMKAQRGPEHKKELIAEKQAMIDAAQIKAEAANVWYKRQQDLAKDNLATKDEVTKARLDHEALLAEINAHKRALDAVKLIRPEDEIKLAQSKVDLAKAKLALAERVVSEHLLKAPYDGFVLQLMANVGDTFGPQTQEPAMTFCSDEELIIRAEVEQEFADNITIGMSAKMEDDSRNGGEWTGKVTRISRWFGPRRSRRYEPRQFNDVRTLECIIKLDKPDPNLRIGQRVRVTLLKPK